MKKILATTVLASGLLFLASCGNGNESSTANASDTANTAGTDSKKEAKEQNEAKFDSDTMKADAAFVVAAADGGMMEVKLGKLALQNAASAEVKKFGQMMVDDHSKANAELKTLAGTKNITIPDSLSNKNMDKYNDLAKKKGADFDDAYTSFMVDDHKDDIDEFKKEADKGGDPEIKSWAAGKVSTLEHHLQMAESAKKSVKK